MITYVIATTLRNITIINNILTLRFVNETLTTINNTIATNINILADNVLISTIIILFILIITVIDKFSKKTKEMIQREEIPFPMAKKLQNIQNNYANNSNTTIVINNFCKIYITPIIPQFCRHITTTQAMNESVNIVLSIEFNAISVATTQLVLTWAVQLSIDAVNCDKQRIHNVCAAFYYFCIFS